MVQSRPIDDEYDGFVKHTEFQRLTLQLLQTLLRNDNDDLVPLLVEVLSTILRVDPLIVGESNAMDMAFHFFSTAPEIPNVSGLVGTVNFWVLRKVWCVGGVERERMLRWLGRAVELVGLASSRGKDDAFILVPTPSPRCLLLRLFQLADWGRLRRMWFWGFLVGGMVLIQRDS